MALETPPAFGGHCCAVKQYFSQADALANTLQITPRVVICKHRLKSNHAYEQIVSIRNVGLHSRHLQYHTDSDLDTTFRVLGGVQSKYLDPDILIQIEITIHPVTKKCINRTRNFYITAEHPNITFEIPIIVMGKDACFPEALIFPQGVPGTITYYEFPIYNATQNVMPVMLKTTYRLLTISVSHKKIPKKDYARVLLKLHVKNRKSSTDNVKLKISGASTYLNIKWIHYPIPYTLYTSISHLYFEELLFNREATKHFTLCNESDAALTCRVEFFSDQYEQEQLALDSDQETEDEVLLSASSRTVHTSKSAIPSQMSSVAMLRDSINVKDYKHFRIEHRTGGFVIDANSLYTFPVTFCPQLDHNDYFDDKDEPPYTLITKLIFTVETEGHREVREVIIRGRVRGPEVEFWPKEVDLRTLYMGELHCELITARNNDKHIGAVIEYKDFLGEASAQVTVTPTCSELLNTCEQTRFLVNIFGRIVGKYQVKLRFKVKNGDSHYVVIKGLSSQIRLKAFPDLIELGSIPVAIPQRREIMLINPLKVPVCVQCMPAEDGEEPPLVLNVRNIHRPLPVNTKDYVKGLYKEDCREVEACDLFGTVKSSTSFHSKDDDVVSACSTDFDDVLYHIPDLAREMVRKYKKVKNPNYGEERVVEESIETLMTFPYFRDFKDHQNYAFVDWNALPNDPQEIYCGNEVFYLSPNTGRNIAVVIIPNKLGYYNRSLDIRCCPIMLGDEGEESFAPDSRGLVKTDLLISKIWIEYNCRVPDILWDNVIQFDYETIYAGQEYEFDMTFENKSNVGGFVYYDIVPRSEEGVMWFRDNMWKFYINPYGLKYTMCSVMFKSFGYKIKMPGLVKFVGVTRGYPFHVIADVHPTRVYCLVQEITRRQNVLEVSRIFIYIDNLTPTITWITFHLKHENEKHQTLNPRGVLLNPVGQGTYIELRSQFYDPDLYKNILYINVRYGEKIQIPITFNIEGMPIFFEPNIKNDFDTGPILTSTEEDFNAGVSNYACDIRVINKGERTYRMVINKLRNDIHKCAVAGVKAHLTVSTKSLVLQPGIDEFIHITGSACEPVTLYNEFSIRVIDTSNPKRVMNTRFLVRANFIQSELVWNRKEITFNYFRTHRFKEQSQFELIQLRNTSRVPVETAELRILGPFKIREHFEDKPAKELGLTFAALEVKEFTIDLNKKAFENRLDTILANGRLQCSANGIPQRAVAVRVNIFNPVVEIMETEVVLFTKYKESEYMVELVNTGCVDAQYKWKKLLEQTNFVGPIDDTCAFAEEVLSDIIRTLNLNDDSDDTELESLYSRALTLRYQHYRCKMLPLVDPIGVSVIIDEIIDRLDLEHKRFALKLDDIKEVQDYNAKTFQGTVSLASSQVAVRETISNVIDLLKLEDSYDISEPSSEDCEPTRTVYFYEKCGIISKGERAQCRLHLPGVRCGYALLASFQLDVVGGNSRMLNITLVNLEKTVKLTRDNIYLGVKPWYELYVAKTCIYNVTEYNTKIQLSPVAHIPRNKRKCNRIADGYVKILTATFFKIPGFGLQPVHVEGIMGFCGEFQRELRLAINDSDEQRIRLRGQGILPMLNEVGKLGRIEQEQEDIIMEYKMLQRVYYLEIFRGIIEEDEELPVGEEEGVKVEGTDSDISLLLTSSSSRSSNNNSSDKASMTSGSVRRAIERERRFFLVMKTYVLVNNNKELPDANILMQLIETEKFLELLNENDDACAALQLVYKNYVKTPKVHHDKIPFNLAHFITQPLPFNLNANVLHMGVLRMGELRKFTIDLQFYGPGKLIASARTPVKIYGLVVYFEVPQQADVDQSVKEKDKEFIYFMAEGSGSDFFDKRYRNMYERNIDSQRLHHCHSYDHDLNLKHKRQSHTLTAKERKSLHNHYNSLNKSVYMERKHHITLCKIFTNSKRNFSGTHLRVVLLLRLEPKFYEDDQLLEDYVYIDLHLGPTLPILLRGLIKAKPK